jgi:copper chaperone
MKTSAALLAALILPTLALASDAAKPAPAADVSPADARLTIPVGGMTCGGCVNNVAGTLKRLDGVKTDEVSLEKKRAYVTYDAAKLSAKAIVDAITQAGFEPGVPVAN